jgi:hypothetical protein
VPWHRWCLVVGSLIAAAQVRTAGAEALRCERYPIRAQPIAGAQAAAQAELSSLSPTASLTWNGDTGTLTAASQLGIPLTGCVDGGDVWTEVIRVLAAHPKLFQLDPSEWRIPEPFNCRFLDGFTIISMGRRSLAGHPVAKDIVAFTLRRVGGVIQLLAVNGTYLPIAGATTGEEMATCANLTEAAAIASARGAALRTSVFERCRKLATVSYTPQPDDGFALFPEAWTWDEETGRVSLSGQRTLRVTLARGHWSAELKLSDAVCPTEDGSDITIGFDITFDIHTGAILNVKPGLDCVVC